MAIPHRLASRHPAWRDQVAEFASSLKKGAHVRLTGYLRSREIEKQVARLGREAVTAIKDESMPSIHSSLPTRHCS